MYKVSQLYVCRGAIALCVIFGALSSSSMATPVPQPWTILVAPVPCASCNSLATLQSAALQYAQTWYGATPTGFPATFGSGINNQKIPQISTGTVLMVTSSSYPISGTFTVGLTRVVHPVCCTVTPVNTTTDISTGTLDSRIFARATVPTVTTTFTHTPDAPELVIQDIQTNMVAAAGIGYNLWHGITNFPQVAYQMVFDAQTGKTYQIYIGDTITVQYSDGWTEKYTFLGTAGGTLQWQVVPDSLRDPSGNPPSTSTTVPSTSNSTEVSGGEYSFNWTYGPITVVPLLPNDGSGPKGIVTVEPIGGGGGGGGSGGDDMEEVDD